MQHIKMSFGYNTICFDKIFTIHTGKIRVKADYASVTKQLAHCPSLLVNRTGRNGEYATISFVTNCFKTNEHLIAEINALLCKIMHERIDAKYAPKVWEPELIDWDHSDMHAEFLAM